MQSKENAMYLMGTPLERSAYRALLTQSLNRTVTAESTFAPVSIWEAMRTEPDVAIIIADRCTSAVREAVQMIPKLRNRTRVMAISTPVTEAGIAEWRGCELHGYVAKDVGPRELDSAVESILRGHTYFTEGSREILERPVPRRGGTPTLSRRELELFPLLAQGLTLREAANQMMISYKTADSYRSNLFRKLGVRDRVALSRLAIRERVIDA